MSLPDLYVILRVILKQARKLYTCVRYDAVTGGIDQTSSLNIDELKPGHSDVDK